MPPLPDVLIIELSDVVPINYTSIISDEESKTYKKPPSVRLVEVDAVMLLN